MLDLLVLKELEIGHKTFICDNIHENKYQHHLVFTVTLDGMSIYVCYRNAIYLIVI